jgi:hypothetical protein
MPESNAIRRVVIRAWSKEGIGVEAGEFGWEILSVAEWPEMLKHATSGWPDGTYESVVVSCSWPASEDDRRLDKTIRHLGVRAVRSGARGREPFEDCLRIFPEPEP